MTYIELGLDHDLTRGVFTEKPRVAPGSRGPQAAGLTLDDSRLVLHCPESSLIRENREKKNCLTPLTLLLHLEAVRAGQD